jgi:hypothetical protein
MHYLNSCREKHTCRKHVFYSLCDFAATDRLEMASESYIMQDKGRKKAALICEITDRTPSGDVRAEECMNTEQESTEGTY